MINNGEALVVAGEEELAWEGGMTFQVKRRPRREVLGEKVDDGGRGRPDYEGLLQDKWLR